MDARTATLNNGSEGAHLVDDDGEELGFSIGQIIHDKYRLDTLLGSGGMGVVFGATHLALDERVAIKLLRPALARNKTSIARFLREARASVKLKGAHVARVTDVDELDSGDPYIVMEWLEGENLASKLEREGPLGIHDVARWLKETCTAIAEAHALGIIHRDLKPPNLFLARAKNGDVSVKVLDFGVSRILDDSGVARGLDTSANLVVGTPHYMAPEQHEGARKADARSDVWALGVIAYELVTGTVPFGGDTPAVVYATIITTETPSPRRLRGDLPEAMDALIVRCIQRDPNARFQSVNELSAALESVLVSSLLPSSSVNNVPMTATTSENVSEGAPAISRGVGPSTAVGVHSVSAQSRRSAWIGALAIGFIGTLVVLWVVMHRARSSDVTTTPTTTTMTTTGTATASAATTPAPPVAIASTSAAPSASASAAPTPTPSARLRPPPSLIKTAGPPPPSSSASPVDESYKHRTSF